jgi:trehalose/maltose hydrolase-like predicted phosphorylase
MYRYHTLPAARAKAARLGYCGALYAWESADTGDEATPTQVVGPDGMVIPILCGTQEQHISADVAYAVWQYWQATEDTAFLLDAGAEIMLETARFWASRLSLEDDGRFHIRAVIGPDEYHESVDDNAYTNIMAQWNLERGAEVADLVRDRWPTLWAELEARLGLSAAEVDGWRALAAAMYTAIDPATGVLEQFAGYFRLEPIDLSLYEGRKVPMDVVLGPQRTRQSQVVKQADVVMLIALLPDRFDRRVREANFRFYEPRCGHGSSLSRGTHALVAARLGDVDLAERYFRETAAIDLEDTTGTGAGGVHMAALGGLWQAAVFGFAGLGLREDGLGLDPRLPAGWTALSFRVQWRGRQVHLRLEGAQRLVTARLERGKPLMLRVGGRAQMLQPWEPWTSCWEETSN